MPKESVGFQRYIYNSWIEGNIKGFLIFLRVLENHWCL